MEILIVLISELLVVITITAMEALVMAVSLAGTILSEIIAALLTSGLSKPARSIPRTPDHSPSVSPEVTAPVADTKPKTTQVYVPPEVADERPMQKRRWHSRIRVAGLVLFLIGLIGVVSIEFIGADPMLRWALKDLTPKTGIEVTFDQVSGGFLRGTLEATNIKLKRTDNDYSNFDLACDKATCRFSIWTILWSRTSFESVTLEHVTGRYERVRRQVSRSNQKTFEIREFSATNCDLEIVDHSGSGEPSPPYRIHIATMESERMRSRWVLFDSLFRSNITGTIEGHPVSITSQPNQEGSTVRWKMSRLPVSIVGDHLKGPFRWIDEGSVDVVMNADVPSDAMPRGTLAMKWQLGFHEIHASLPDGLNLAMRTVAQLAVNELNRKIDGLKIEFDAKLPMVNGVAVFSSDAILDSLWEEIGASARDSILQKLGVNPEDVKKAFSGDAEKLMEKGKDAIKKGLNRLKSIRPSGS